MDLAYGNHEVYNDAFEPHRPLPAPFLIKTYQLVDDANTDAIVSWSDDGTTFIVWRPPEFARDVLPNYFKHNNFSSFVRQLNTYGFRKTAPQRWEFANDYFRKGHSHLLCEIHRRIKIVAPQISGNVLPISRSSPSSSGEEQTWSSRSTSSPTEVASATNSVSDENDRLRRDNCILLSELARIQRLYDNAVIFLKNETKIPLQALEQKLHSSESLWFRSGQVDSTKGKQCMVEQLSAASKIQNNVLKEAANQNRSWNVQNAIEISSSRGGNASHGSTIAYVQGKLQELITCSAKSKEDASCDQPVPKLFGVPLCDRKRLHPDLRNESDIASDYIELCATSKTLKSEITSGRSTTTSVERPWLRCSAARDDKRVHAE